jgi:endonuclease YncB( thermonuclease family)
VTPIVLICLSLAMSDGDSGRCRTADGENLRVRLRGVDAGEVAPFTRCRQTPEVWACSSTARAWGDAARSRARDLAADGARCTVVERDRYRRIVAVCTVNGRDLGQTLVREGLAVSETNFGDPYRIQEDEARRAGRGLWKQR